MNNENWLELMDELEFAQNLQTYHSLVDAYQQPHRYYHNKSHIKATLSHLADVKQWAERPEEIELALWFHDAIYKPYSQTNEQDSAEWATEFLLLNQARVDQQKRIQALIMATCHHAQPYTFDQSLMVDIDLTILGASTDLYDQYEGWIRKEYRWVPKIIYNKKRKKLLTQFLDRKTIYHTEIYRNKLEAQARSNLARAINAL